MEKRAGIGHHASPLAVPRDPERSCSVNAVARERVRLQHDFRVSAPAFEAVEWLVHVAAAPSGEGQLDTTTDARVLLADRSLRLRPGHEYSRLGRPICSRLVPVEAPASPGTLHVRTVYETTILRRELVPGHVDVDVAPLSALETDWYCASTPALDFDSAAMRARIERVDLSRHSDESGLAFARRVLWHLKRHFRWVDVREFDPGHRASSVCEAGRGDCAKLSLLFVSILRAGRVPARILGVRWIPSGDGHIMTEFHAGPVGWVPVDVLVDREGETRFSREGNQEGFGSTTGDYFVHYVDDGFRLATFEGVQEILGLHSVAWYARGHGTLAGHVVEENWSVTPTLAARL